MQVQALTSIKTSRTATQKKIGSRLFLAVLHQQADPRLTVLTDFRFVKPEADGRVPVDIGLVHASDMKSVLDKLATLDALVNAKSLAYRQINARVRLQDVETVAALPGVLAIRKAVPHATNKIDTSEGDTTHGANEARGYFGVTGGGVKVCVLSDGVDSLATLETSGDVAPTVDVLPSQAGSGDEGTAMLEIVHDLAPGAAEGFATAFTSEPSFAANILALAASGCNIIADDVIYFDESPFEDGPVAQAVNTVTASGVIYFSSAGNEGNLDDGTSGTWEGDFRGNGTPAALAGGGTANDFGDGGQSILVTGSGQASALIWAEHYTDSTHGIASTDYDLYDMDGGLTTIYDASTNTQDGTGGDDVPVEISGPAFTGERLVVMQFAAGTTSSVPMFNLIEFRGTLDSALATSGATRGHSATVAAFSVAATPAVSPGPYPGLFTAADSSEVFSSDGPRRIILDGVTGNELTPGDRTSTGGVVRQKPDITAADGVSVAAPGFSPFYGTSAAAPHAAAIAALLKSGVPGITPAQVRSDLISSAIDIEAGGVDRDTGAGIVMAHAALQTAGALPQAYLNAGTAVPTEIIGDGDAYVENYETWSLTIPLDNNSGGANATAISAVLSSSTPGIAITSPNSTYPDLAVGNSGNNNTPFVFSVSGAASCGTAIDFTLTVTYSGGPSPQTFNFSIPMGSAGTPQTTQYTGPAVAIPDAADLSGSNPGAPAQATLPISGITGNIFSATMSIDGTTCNTTAGSTTVGLDHSFVSDLQIHLISPSSTSVLVINNTDGSGNNFCQTVLDDAAGTSIQSVTSAQAPFTGTFSPNASLSAFTGENPNGNWQLQAQDFFQFDTGNIRAFSITVTPAVCNAPVVNPVITATKQVTGGNQFAGGTVVYTVTLTNSGSGPQFDNPGDEFTDVLPAALTLVNATASSGTAVATVGTNTVTWNGAIGVGGTVTITINATISASASGQTITNQGTVAFDADSNGTNESTALTDDPAVGGATDPTAFIAAAPPEPVKVPAATVRGLILVSLCVAALALFELRRRRRRHSG